MTFRLESSAFSEAGTIPVRFTGEGDNHSPPLHWTGAPASTQSFALIVEDPDAPNGPFTHWVLFDIPAGATSLHENWRRGRDPGVPGRNDFGNVGYSGPMPPRGDRAHHYVFRLFATDLRRWNLPEGASRAEVEAAMEGRVLAEATLTGRYARVSGSSFSRP